MSVLNRRLFRWASTLAVGAAAAVALSPAPAEAQYFGRNKVQYRTFDFRILRTPHFDVYFYPEEEVAARDAARMIERWYARLSRVLDYEFEARQPLILYASHPHFQQTTVLGGEIGEGTGGVTEVFKQRIILPLANSYAETDHVLGHELVHAFQYDITGFGRAGPALEEAAQRFNTPLWFTEGMAEYLSIGPVDPHTSMWLRDAALTGRLPTLEQLTYDPRFFPYRWGQALWAYIGGRWGDAAIGQIMKQVGQGVPYEEAFQRILNAGLEEIVEDWHTSIRRTYLPLLTERREAREEARPLITEQRRGGTYNLAPSVSPDGRRIVFLSELEFLDVEMYVADAETGRVERRLVRGTAFDPHYGSLRYINSAGTWAPDNRRFAFSALRKGRDVLVVLDVDRARVLREYAVDEVSEITSPTWSPDGSTIVFSGLSGGISDLWALDVATGSARRLTNDRYGDLQPAYSPDGRTIAFVSERGGDTDLDALRFDNFAISLMDMATGEVRPAPGMAGAKNINPSWTRDGSGIYFLSNRAGIPNIYRADLASGRVTQVTNLFTGVSGITALSPAISSSQNADRLAFTVYERGNYNIYSITNPAELAGVEPVTPQLAANGAPLPAILPPSPRPPEPAFNRVTALLSDPAFGLPAIGADRQWAVVPYRPRLSLDWLGQPTVGVSASTGPYARGGLYGGIGGIFSDVLGRHTVYGTIQAQGQLEEIGFSAAYINQSKRWNYGAGIQRVPYLAGARAQGVDEQGFLHDQLLIYRVFDSSIGLVTQYPFSRVQRVEFSGGFRRIDRDIQTREYIYQPSGGGFIGPVDYRESEDNLDAFNLGEASAALVYDNSLFSYTSPFAGQRYRFEVSPTFGSLQFLTATADYRRYLFLRPFTLAVRGMHYGRYGRDDDQLSPVFLGYSSLMRGYTYGSVSDACTEQLESGDTDPEECQIYEALFGSRIAVANAELRVPIFRQIVLGGGFPLPPVEGIAFFDAGTSWGDLRRNDGTSMSTRPVFRRGLQSDLEERGILTSAGVGARVNLFGYVILEAVYVNAFDRPRGWHWEFALQPGF